MFYRVINKNKRGEKMSDIYKFYNCTELAKPYDDEYMTYDYKRSRYNITVGAINNELDIDLTFETGSLKRAEAFAKEMSNDIYRLIYKYTRVSSKDTKEYYLSNCSSLREVLYNAILAQARAGHRSGLHIFKDQHGVNLEKGTSVGINKIRGLIGYSEEAYDELASNGLLFAGYIPQLVDKMFEKGVDY